MKIELDILKAMINNLNSDLNDMVENIYLKYSWNKQIKIEFIKSRKKLTL